LEATQKQHSRPQEQFARAQQEHASILVAVVKDIQKLKAPPITRAIGFRIPDQPPEERYKYT